MTFKQKFSHLGLICTSLVFSLMSYSAEKSDEEQWQTFTINSEHSKIRFQVPYMGITSVSGQFKKFKGTFKRHRQSGKVKNINVQVQATSVDTADMKRDKHLRSKDFFDVQNYPIIHLKNGEIFNIKDDAYNSLKAQLTLRGETRPLTLKTQSLGEKKDQMGKKVIFFKARGKVNRKKFGMRWNQVLDNGGFVIGDIIKLRIRVEASPIDQKPAFSRFMTPPKRKEHNPARPLDKRSKTHSIEELKSLNERIDRLTSKVVQKEQKIKKIKTKYKDLKYKLKSTEKKRNEQNILVNTATLTFLLLVILGSTTWVIKCNRTKLFITIPDSILNSNKKQNYSLRWILEWLGDFLLLVTLTIVIWLSFLYF